MSTVCDRWTSRRRRHKADPRAIMAHHRRECLHDRAIAHTVRRLNVHREARSGSRRLTHEVGYRTETEAGGTASS
jgi:hypothetical protein